MALAPATPHADLPAFAAHLRAVLETKKCVLLYAYNGTGKTRLSMAFKDIGKVAEARDTLYFNAFTEDLFSWDNDLDGDTDRKLRLNKDSKFFKGLVSLEMDNRIRPLLQRYADFDFVISALEESDDWHVRFSRTVAVTDADGNATTETLDNIKVSRGEENIFIWCFFLAIAELAIATTDDAEPYAWVKHIYVDDPISSLDEHNAVNVACHIAQLLRDQDRVTAVISTHHTLFFNVLCNEFKHAKRIVQNFLAKGNDGYVVRDTRPTPFYHHVAIVAELQKAADSGALYPYHFNMLRTVMEKTSNFHGFKGYTAFIKQEDNDPEGVLHSRLLNIMNHGDHSLFGPVEMVPENKEFFRRMLAKLRADYTFNPDLFETTQQAAT